MALEIVVPVVVQRVDSCAHFTNQCQLFSNWTSFGSPYPMYRELSTREHYLLHNSIGFNSTYPVNGVLSVR